MSNIRNFHVVPGKAEAEADFSEKIKKHKMTSILRNIVCFLVIAIIAVLLIIQYKNQVFTNAIITSQADYKKVDNTYFTKNDGNIITYSKDGISCIDSKGKTRWNMTYEMQKPIVRTAKGIVAVGDSNGHIIYMIDGNGAISQVDTNLPLRDFSVSENGVVAAILENSGNLWVNVYNKSGELLVEAKATMSMTGYPMTVSISGEVMGVSYFSVDGSQMRSSVTFYNFGGVGENVTDHIVSSYDYVNAVVPTLHFLNEESAFAVADNRLMFFSGSKKPTGVADILLDEEIQGIYYGDNYVGLVFYDKTGTSKYRLDVYADNGKMVMSHLFDMDFKDILIQNEQIMIYNESQCSLLSMKDREKYTGTFENPVFFVTATDSPRKFVLITENSLETMELK